MAVPSLIDFRDLNQWLELHQVVSSPASNTQINVWGRVYPTSETRADFVIHNGFAFDQFTNDDWQLWYFVYAGHNWRIAQFDIVDGHRLVMLECVTTSSLDGSGLSDLDWYPSDSDAAIGGVAVGEQYIADIGHERADYGGITTRIS